MTSFQNYKNYRKNLDEITGTCLPYLGVYLRDLLFIEEGNPDRMENGMVHFQKMTMVGSIITRIQTFQMLPYRITPIEEILQFFTKPPKEAIVSGLILIW